ncbi:MAG: glycosyltransferase family 2 protein [Limisphaerales bacterium]
MSSENKSRSGPKFSVLVPCYNEIEALPEAVETLIEKVGKRGRWELIVIDDGSTDGTGEQLQKLEKKIAKLQVIKHEFNRGYGAALKTGIHASRSNIIVITDADGTYPNERIPDLVGLADKYDMVVGARTSDNVTYSKIRAIPKVFLRAYASWIAGEDIPDINSGLRAFKKDVILRFLPMLSNKFSFTTTSTLAFLTNDYRVTYEPIDYFERTGQSKIQPIRDTLRFVTLIMRMGMYFAPLRVLTPFIGALSFCFLVSLCFDVFVIENITDKTIMLLLFSMNTGFFALLADMIEKRNARG